MFNSSDPFNDTHDGDTLAKDVVGFIDAMKLDKPILMGHSMGAATVMRVGAQYPDAARAIIMLDPGLGRPPGVSSVQPSSTQAPAAQPPPAQAPTTRRPGSMSMFGAPELLVAQNNDTFENFVEACERSNRM